MAWDTEGVSGLIQFNSLDRCSGHAASASPPPENENPGALAGATGACNFKAVEASETEYRDSPSTAIEASRPKRVRRAPQTRQERWRARNPLANWAHAATRTAIRLGLLKPQPCVVCGSPDAEAHHPDHRDPLRVEWLCRAHHKALHAKLQKRG